MKRTVLVAWALSLSAVGAIPQATLAAELDPLLAQLAAADQSADPSAGAAAWQQLASGASAELPKILAAIDSSRPLAANWLRSAVDAIAERTLDAGASLPTRDLERFVLETEHDPRARRQAYEWLIRVDQAAEDRLIPDMLLDPSVEMRRDAVAVWISRGAKLEDQGNQESAIEAYREALAGARDEDQVKQLAKQLRALGQEVDLPRHFGFLQEWFLIAPFDNTGRKGFAAVYPPEQNINLYDALQGKDGSVRWQRFRGEDDFGMIDLNQPFGPLKEVVGYAWTRFESAEEREVELRLGCKNAWKIWLNGSLVFAREEYHRGLQMDQYQLKVTLKPGPNQILLKLCQNEQTESWTEQWEFQLRVCDAAGTAILSKSRDD